MNEVNYINYDNYYCNSIQQQQILNDVNPMIMDYDMTAASVTSSAITQSGIYLNSGSCDMIPNTICSSGDQRTNVAHTNVFTYLSQATRPSEQERLDDFRSVNNCVVTTASAAGVTSAPTVFGNIPFVQIHTTDVQPQHTSYGNVFRRNVSKQEEIKSEPIKSENTDAAGKDRTNATPTPPRSASASQAQQDVSSSKTEETSNKKIEHSTSTLEIYKCTKCPFISLSELEKKEHCRTQHDIGGDGDTERVQRQEIKCLGCTNIFYAEESLVVHLKLDHLMKTDDITKLMKWQKLNLSSDSNIADKESPAQMIEKAEDPSQLAPAQERKSRIYLKNVECLREPNRQPMEHNDNQLMEQNKTQTDDSPNTISLQPPANPPKQKISIKSVDVLREPALLRRDYQYQNNNNFSVYLSDTNLNNLNTEMNINLSTVYDYSKNGEIMLNSGQNTAVGVGTASQININNNNNNNANGNAINNVNSMEAINTTNVSSAEKPRKPKIYVKSVESFNLMPMESMPTSATGYLTDHNTLCNSNNQVYDTSRIHLPYLFEPSNTSNCNNSSSDFITNHVDDSQLITTSNSFTTTNIYDIDTSTNFIDNSNIMENVIVDVTAVPSSSLQTSASASLEVENTYSKIVNKPCQTTLSSIQEQRGTLHLRTVDELNLMNKNEVQNLIAPNLDNNHIHSEEVAYADLNCINMLSETLYEDENFKFHDLDTQMVASWPQNYEDLEDDINCIIADDGQNDLIEDNQKLNSDNINENANSNSRNNNNNNSVVNNSYNPNDNNFDIETPTVSLITIRDIEELTGAATNEQLILTNSNEFSELTHQQQQQIHAVTETNTEYQNNSKDEEEQSNLKREQINATPETLNSSLSSQIGDKSTETSNNVQENSLANEFPAALIPIENLEPVSTVNTDLCNTAITLQTNPTANKTASNPVSCSSYNVTIAPPIAEKGRIYVASNLMESPKKPTAVTATCGTSIRGRPFGSNRTGITKLKQVQGSNAEELWLKCTVKGCAFRFKKTETLEYHRKCHDISCDSPQANICPECKSKEHTNWNTLHTHLWRSHQVDMELYKCELCEFRTPIFSRLANTHAKIHSDDRNYKCEHCNKAFKNTKQLKNHRRFHRTQSTTKTSTNSEIPTIHQCLQCNATFAQALSLKEHCCKNGTSPPLTCDVCEKALSSKSSLKLHMLSHENGDKRHKCKDCDYATNDHNAFRRHRMNHENRKMYNCKFCTYQTVQSVAYQKHIQHKHPDEADSIIFRCSSCSFTTINKSLLVVHQAKHSSNSIINVNNNVSNHIEKIETINLAATDAAPPKSKIKVKSNLFTATNECDVPADNDEFVVTLNTFENNVT